MRKFAFLDLDGTIIDHNQVISPKVKDAITTATANGHKVFVATGRSYPELYPFLFSLPFSGLITANGKPASPSGQIISAAPAPPGFGKEKTIFIPPKHSWIFSVSPANLTVPPLGIGLPT